MSQTQEPKPTEQAETEKRPKTKKHRKLMEAKKKRRKEVRVARIPGVVTVLLSANCQLDLKCIAGEYITSENPWLQIDKELIMTDLQSEDPPSGFSEYEQQIKDYPRKQMLIGLAEQLAGDEDMFYICITEAATDAVNEYLMEQEAKLQLQLKQAMIKFIKPWVSKGSEEEVDAMKLVTNRALLEVEIESTCGLAPQKIQFQFRTAEQARDGYLGLTSDEDRELHIFRKKIDRAIQVTPASKTNEAQTICTYPSNSSTQYEYIVEIDDQVWRSYGPAILSFFKNRIDGLMDSLVVNRNINLYLDDYQHLSLHTLSRRSLIWLQFSEYMSFSDVALCEGKMISSAHWQPLMSGVAVISYVDQALNSYQNKPLAIDEVQRAERGNHPVLLWTFVDALNPRLIMFSNRQISTVSICPFNENVLIGGSVNGQIIVWDITNRLDKVEEQEVLTTKQAKYRVIMRSMMTWMKDTLSNKLVSVTAVSDLRYSHTAPVVRISWINPYEELDKSGRAYRLPKEGDKRSLQFMTAGEDGHILIWDLLKKPGAGSTAFRERRLRRLEKMPSGLSSEISPFRILHRNLKPIFQINVQHPTITRPMTVTMFTRPKCLVQYEKKTNVKNRSKDRDYYNAIPHYPEEKFHTCFKIGTAEGDYAECEWRGLDFDMGIQVNMENCTYRHFSKFHCGPVYTVSEHRHGDLTLTVGGKTFAIWSKKLENRPVFWRKGDSLYTFGSFYKHLSNRFRLLRFDGVYEMWCITSNSKLPAMLLSFASGPLLTANAQNENLSMGLSDYLGNYRIFQLPQAHRSEQRYFIENDIVKYLETEVERKTKYSNWQTAWNERLEAILKAQQAEVVVQVDPMAGMKPEEPKKKKGKMSDEKREKKEYQEWLEQKKRMKEEQHVKETILSKRGIDPQLLHKERIPLNKIEQEDRLRQQKQKDKLRGAEDAFRETVAMLFPALVKEKREPPPDPYAERHSTEDKKDCYEMYENVATEAFRYLKNTSLRIDFDWKQVLREGKRRRKFLDPYFPHAHYEELAEKGRTRTVPQEQQPASDVGESEEPSIVEAEMIGEDVAPQKPLEETEGGQEPSEQPPT